MSFSANIILSAMGAVKKTGIIKGPGMDADANLRRAKEYNRKHPYKEPSDRKAAYKTIYVRGYPCLVIRQRHCEAVGTKITVSGKGNRLVGGLVGFEGSYDETAPAQITGCKVEDVSIVVSDSTDFVGGLIGAGKEMMEGSDVMSSFEIRECSVSGSITGGGAHVDAVVGDPACAVSIDCDGGMEVGQESEPAALVLSIVSHVVGDRI